MNSSERESGSRSLMKSWTLEIAPEKIALFKAAVESYDNLATLRTEDPRLHLLRLWFAADAESDLRELVDSLAPAFAIRVIGVHDVS